MRNNLNIMFIFVHFFNRTSIFSFTNSLRVPRLIVLIHLFIIGYMTLTLRNITPLFGLTNKMLLVESVDLLERERESTFYPQLKIKIVAQKQFFVFA